MKTLQAGNNAAIRVSDEKAVKLVEAGTHVYVPKSVWKEQTRKPTVTNDAKETK
jgi:hypothetical protein